MQFYFVYITTANIADARKIGEVLVQEKLAACANIFPQMESIYRWKGVLERDNEVVLIVKTREDLLKSVTNKVVDLHPYECPCVVGIPVSGGHDGYFSWLNEQLNSGHES